MTKLNIELTEENFNKLPDKKITIRKGRKGYKLGKAFIISSEKERVAMVNILRVEYTKLSNIYECDIKNDGFKDWDDAFQGLKKHYPDLTWDDELTVVKFSVYGVLDDTRRIKRSI